MLDWDKVRAAVITEDDKTRMIMLNTPHNPTGTTWTGNRPAPVGSVWSRDTNIFILSDEVCDEHITFDGYRHPSILGYPALRRRAFACFSFGKAYHCTGWKIVVYCICAAHADQRSSVRCTSSTAFQHQYAPPRWV